MPTGKIHYPSNRYHPPDNVFILSPRDADFVRGLAPELPMLKLSDLLLIIGCAFVTVVLLFTTSETSRASLVGWGIVVLVLSIVGAYKLWQWYRLTREGVLLTGTIVKVKGYQTYGRGGGYNVSITCEFTTPDGQTLQRSHSETRNDLNKDSLPTEGTPIAVWYAPPNIAWVM